MAQAAAQNGAPQWYCRIMKLRGSTFPTSEDYDKDLSELGDEDLDDEYPDCKCDEQDIDCYCDELWESSETKLRDGKYTGPDAAHFYEVKADRSLRKHDVADARFQKEAEKQERLKLDRDKENKVLEVLKDLTESGGDDDHPAELDLLTNRHFDLYCSEFTKLWWDDYFPIAYINFYDLGKDMNLGVPISLGDDGILRGGSLDDEDRNKMFNPDDKKLNIQGHIYFNVFGGCDFSRFDPPSTSERKIVY